MTEPKIIFVLYEGKHDAAILTRLLRMNGYGENKDKKLNTFPPKLKGYFKSIINNFTYVDESSLLQKPMLPNHLLYNTNTGDKWYVFYEMGGDTKAELTKNLLSKLQTTNDNFDISEQFETESPVSLAFFFDADFSLQKRLMRFVKDYNNILPKFCKQVETKKSNYTLSNDPTDGFAKIGLFVYCTEEDSGTLEDIVIPLMKEGNEDAFNDAKVYLNKFMTATESKQKKALIGIVGQPKHAGKANQVIISDTKMLNKEKFDRNATFTQILNFLISF